MIARLRLVALALLSATSACHAFLEPGYVNSAHVQGPGGTSLALRGGTGDFRDKGVVSALDIALRSEASSSGSSFALGTSATVAPNADWKHSSTPYLRAGVWWLPARWGPARDASAFEPSLDLGMLLYGGYETYDRSLLELGGRVGYDAHPDGVAESFIWTLYVGFGTSHSFNCCN